MTKRHGLKESLFKNIKKIQGEHKRHDKTFFVILNESRQGEKMVLFSE